MPELQFKLDTSFEYSDNISRLLNELKEAEGEKEADGTGEEEREAG